MDSPLVFGFALHGRKEDTLTDKYAIVCDTLEGPSCLSRI